MNFRNFQTMRFLIASGLALASASNECGRCWEMGESGECNPAPGTISTVCGSNSITMSIAACVLDGSHVYSGPEIRIRILKKIVFFFVSWARNG